MLESILTFLYGTIVLAFGIALSTAFAGLRFSKRNFLVFLGLFLFSGILQLIATVTFSEVVVWKLYPLIAHLPLILLLCFVYKKPLATAVAATFTAYLCCQPSKWFGVLMNQFTNSAVVGLAARILFLFPVGYLAIFHLSSYLSDIFNKDTRSICIFGFVPTVYYIFDYVTVVYTNLWLSNIQVVMEFLSFLIVVMYMVFCLLYYKEYEQRAEAQRKEQIIRIAVEQQSKEFATIQQIKQDIHLLRHDMRMFLSSLAISIESGNTETAQEMIHSQITRIEGTKLQRFCNNNIVNYVISDYAARCKEEGISFQCAIKLDELKVDEIMFSSILSNALDNALNAQKLQPIDSRSITLMLKNSDGKLLLSVKNPVSQPIAFAEGLPVSGKHGHGYGAQSIRYVTEKLGGNCQFFIQDDIFIFRAVL